MNVAPRDAIDNSFAFTCRCLLRSARFACLATIDSETSHPYASLVAVSTAVDGSPLLMLSTLAIHTRNLKADPRVSLLVHDESAAAAGADLLASDRLTVFGQIAQSTDDGHRRRYFARHPGAADFAEFSDFAIYRIAPERLHSVAGFGRIDTRPATSVFLSAKAAAPFEAGEERSVAGLNEDFADAIQAIATSRPETDTEDWRATGCDPDGVYLGFGSRSIRMTFNEPVTRLPDLSPAFEALFDGTRL